MGAAAKVSGDGAGHVVGDVVDIPLDEIRPNDWNPNKLSARKYESIKTGFRQEGWVRSQSMTIWRTDERGRKKNLIIDGEHRWKAAREIGMTSGPGVYLDGLTLAKARALTVKLDGRRGDFDSYELAELVASIPDESALMLGMEDAEYAGLLDSMGADPIGGEDAEPPGPIAKTRWSLIIECTGERHQARLLRKLTGEGLKCRPL